MGTSEARRIRSAVEAIGKQHDSYRRKVEKLEQQLAEVRAEAAVKDAALRQVEWFGLICPWCKGFSEESWAGPATGHKSDCPRQAALSGDAGSRLLEAVRVLASVAERITHDNCGHVSMSTDQNCCVRSADQARAILHDIGILEGE